MYVVHCKNDLFIEMDLTTAQEVVLNMFDYLRCIIVQKVL